MDEDELQKLAENITSKDEFIAFLGHLVADGRDNADKWENVSSVSYVDGMRGYLGDTNKDAAAIQGISWAQLAELMLAARVYE